MVDPDYDRALVEAGLDHKSPMSVDGYFKKITDDLYAQPGAVDRMKNLLIAKHIIPPSAVKLSLAQPGVVDGYMTNALMWAINTTTAYNASLFKLGKPNQKYMGVQDYLNNMNPISVSTTDTQVVHNQVTSKDYELSIDNMFQNTLGRGATADELEQFTKQLQSYVDKNPSKTVTTQTENTLGTISKPGYNTVANQSGGLTDAAVAAMERDAALKDPEAEKYAKGATFFNWFQQAIDAPVQLGG